MAGTLNERLVRQAMAAQGIRHQRELAQRTGIHEARLSGLLAGHRRPRRDEIARIYGALDILSVEHAVGFPAGLEYR